MNLKILLWVYIVVLMAGGLMGYLKAGSKASLIASTVFALIIAAFALDLLSFRFAYVYFLFLAIFFARRYWRNKKFMPNGLMTIISLVFFSAALMV